MAKRRRILQEHIVSSFVKNGRALAVAGIDLGVVGQAEQALDDVCAQLLIATPWKIGAAYATTEERVAREDPSFYFSIEADTAHGMAWRTDDFQGALPYFDDLAILQIDIGQVAIT